MTAPPPRRLLVGGLAAVALLGAVALGRAVLHQPVPPPPPVVLDSSDLAFPRKLAEVPHLTVWWDALPPEVRDVAAPSAGPSNIHPKDYVGPQVCARCHARNYELWSHHPHSRMNALANDRTVLGDFSGTSVSYRGERLTFFRDGTGFGMCVEAPGVRRVYHVTQTIGSRFFQYYVGRQVEGPEPAGHRFSTHDHVLPFGYWLAEKEWVPVIHIGPEVPDAKRPDPAAPPDHGPYYADYAVGCNACHTTFPLGDLLGRQSNQMGLHAPLTMHWRERPYLAEAHPDMLPAMERFLRGEEPPPEPAASPGEETTDPGRGVAAAAKPNPMSDWEAPHYAVTLGVSCEACHLGCREHVASEGKVLPRFVPSSPDLAVVTGGPPPATGRTHDNVNWACGRCHTGGRPRFAAGMATWNSIEYADAMRGSCYSQLRCVDCHNPHRATGPKWSQTADQDDARCLTCHAKYEPAGPRLAHTHHPAGSAGARCMNCHMPRINEGLENVVRTHMIYSPTRADMIEANHPNACNLCHTDRPIDWTLDYLKKWYGGRYDEKKIAAHYPRRNAPVVEGWLQSANASVRLVAVEALARARDPRAVPRLLDALDDPYLVNRQFAFKGLQELLGVRLRDYGYHIYQTEEERKKPLAALRAKLCPAAATGGR
jgi:predicted CXXCH cytochrome family protein